MPTDTPCALIAAGHAIRPITYWRRTTANERHDVASIEPDGPDTLVLVLRTRLGPDLLAEAQDGPTTLRYCNHDVAAILADFARYTSDWQFLFHVPELAIEVRTEEGLRRHALVEAYRYRPCAELTRDPRDPFSAFVIPRIPELDQIRRIDRPSTPVPSGGLIPPEDDDDDAELLDDDIDGEHDDLEAEDWGEGEDHGEDEDEALIGEVIAKVRIAASDWFDGSASDLVALSPTELGTIERWHPSEPGEARTWPIAEDDRPGAALRWAVEEIDRVLDGFSGAEHLLRLIVDRTVGAGFLLVCCDANMDEAEVAGEEGETFGVRITLTDGLDGVDPAPAWLAEPVDGLRTELRWSVVADGVTYALDPDERGAQEETGGDR